MDPRDFELLQQQLEPVDLPLRTVLAEAWQPLDHTYFLEEGMGSIVVTSAGGRATEAGVVGFEGCVPVDGLLGSDLAAHRAVVQIAGAGHRISFDALTAALDASPTLRIILSRFAHIMAVQTSFTALANAVYSVDERLARWLLMCQDRHPGDDIPLTHAYLALMLAVRRPSVTTAIHILEGKRLIWAERGSITIRDRLALEAFAGDCYGGPEREYRRLIGPIR